MVVVLRPTEAELHLAANVGVLRMIFAFRASLQGKYGCEDVGCASHVAGAIGEMMLAKHRNIYWAGTIGNLKAADVGEHYQVRATELPHGKLIVHPPDNDDQPFVLARVLLPEVHLVGWLWGREAKRDQYWRKDVPRPAYFAWPVHDMATLPGDAEIKREAELKRQVSLHCG